MFFLVRALSIVKYFPASLHWCQNKVGPIYASPGISCTYTYESWQFLQSVNTNEVLTCDLQSSYVLHASQCVLLTQPLGPFASLVGDTKQTRYYVLVVQAYMYRTVLYIDHSYGLFCSWIDFPHFHLKGTLAWDFLIPTGSAWIAHLSSWLTI